MGEADWTRLNMPFFKGTYLFEYHPILGDEPPVVDAPRPPQVGFSESWSIFDDVEGEGIATFLSFIKERARLLSEDWQIIGLRVARYNDFLQGEQCKVRMTPVMTPICLQPTRGAIQESADTPWAAVLVQMDTRQSTPSSGRQPRPRQWQLRGIPDIWWRNGLLQMPPEAKGEIGRFCRFITTQMEAGNVVQAANCELHLLRYTGCCIKRISNRRIGRPFGLIRGRRWSRRTVNQ
jgi:hypothetical protein